jgi:iron complex transport system substrate-binding protein
MYQLLRVVTLVLAVTLGLSACTPAVSRAPVAQTPPAQQASFPVTVTDDLGRSVRIEKLPQRIVSTAPSNTEILFALGLNERIVAVTDFCDYPEAAKAKPKIGGTRPSVERIIAFSPDLVVASTINPQELIQQLEGAGIAVVVWGPKDFAGIMRNIEQTGVITGTIEQARRITAGMKSRIDAVAAKARQATTKPRVFFEVDATDPAKPFTAGPGSFVDAMITLAGGQNVAAGAASPWPQFSLEELVRADPDIIILSDYAYGVTPESVARRPGWENLTAVKKGAIKPIEDPNIVVRPGPRIVDGLELMARLIQPDLFKS